MIIDKEENLKPTNELRITFNYSKIKEDMLESYLELMSKVHNYLSDLRHKTFFQADIKHEYFSVILHSEDRHLFAFTISEIEQLQSTRMPQEFKSAGFTMLKLINIMLELISELYLESSLMYEESSGPASITFYMNDLFSEHSDFKSQFTFL